MTNFLQRDAYQQRVQARDPCCLITGLVVQADDYSRFKAAHIFPRAHDIEVGPYPHLFSFGSHEIYVQ